MLAYKREVRKKTEFGWEDCEFILPDTEFPTLCERPGEVSGSKLRGGWNWNILQGSRSCGIEYICKKLSVAREGMDAMHGTLEEVTRMGLKKANQPENIVDTWPGSEHHGSAGSKGILGKVIVGGLSPSHIFTLI